MTQCSVCESFLQSLGTAVFHICSPNAIEQPACPMSKLTTENVGTLIPLQYKVRNSSSNLPVHHIQQFPVEYRVFGNLSASPG